MVSAISTSKTISGLRRRIAPAGNICVETHSDGLGYHVLLGMFAGLVAKDFALNFH